MKRSEKLLKLVKILDKIEYVLRIFFLYLVIILIGIDTSTMMQKGEWSIPEGVLVLFTFYILIPSGVLGFFSFRARKQEKEIEEILLQQEKETKKHLSPIDFKEVRFQGIENSERPIEGLLSEIVFQEGYKFYAILNNDDIIIKCIKGEQEKKIAVQNVVYFNSFFKVVSEEEKNESN